MAWVAQHITEVERYEKHLNFYATISFREKKRSKEIACFVLHFSLKWLIILNVVVSLILYFTIKFKNISMSSLENMEKCIFEHSIHISKIKKSNHHSHRTSSNTPKVVLWYLSLIICLLQQIIWLHLLIYLKATWGRELYCFVTVSFIVLDTAQL